MKGSEVKKILRNRGYIMQDIAKEMDESPQNLQSILRSDDMKIGKLERIAKAINKDVYFFLDERYKRDVLSLAQSSQDLSDETSKLIHINEVQEFEIKTLNRENSFLRRENAYLRGLIGDNYKAAEGEQDPYGVKK